MSYQCINKESHIAINPLSLHTPPPPPPYTSSSPAILIAHLKLSPGEMRQVLTNMTTERLEPAHIKQLLLYAPDDEEVKQYEHFDGDPAKLSEPDQFIFQVQTL